ncbi:MED6-domain-containing protein [Cryphonectria parasitica EP155]|uniref:Mediator of RNA polymerase II transcription subunit 6 n=1 Tax=Cryphonectria parasitica (strain ATCC 38755 / EP155) TaxID=660469 RepID=A0A9P4YEG9_CRYP1|nr:MED6-domain-containing protein [Cryphonectria parasitica EP155]KAF3771000.1 MED6-domain-containing protein [Cryphonectria parasitica EP155]
MENDDETSWFNPHFIMQHGPLHNDTILIYFADSPWCERTSNNKTIMNQALYNPAMAAVVTSRAQFEARLRSMSGLEYMVSEAPAETLPDTGTGVWVIRKQTRKKRGANLEDEVTVHASYYVVGANIYPAPSLMDIMSSKLATISHAIGNVFEAANRIQTWTPAQGHSFANPALPRAGTAEPKEATPMPNGSGARAGQSAAASKVSTKTELDARLAEDSFNIHMACGGYYMDEIPITGKPGDFHFANTGRKDKLAVPQTQAPAMTPPVLAPLNTAQAAEAAASSKDIKKTKSPKPGSAIGSKNRRKSKAGTAIGTPTPS